MTVAIVIVAVLAAYAVTLWVRGIRAETQAIEDNRRRDNVRRGP